MKPKILTIVIMALIQLCSINQIIAQSSLIITPDSTFGTNGNMVLSNTANSNQQTSSDFAVEPNGKFLVVGPSGSGGGQPYIAQYLSNGTPDNSFGTNGFTILHTNTTNYTGTPTNITLLQSGKILVILSGDSVLGFDNTLQTFSVLRINANGTIDQSFGTNGYLNFATDNPNQAVPGGISSPQVLVLAGDSLVLKYLYNSHPYGMGITYLMYLLKTDSNGNFDNQFGTNGTDTLPASSGSISLCNNNTFFFSGYINNGVIAYSAYMRYLSNGKLDNSFGSNGVLIDNTGGGGVVVVQPDNSVVVSGNPVIHILSNGTIDGTYNNNSGGGNLSGNTLNGIFTLNNETLFANNIYESIPGTSYRFLYAQLQALFSNGVTDSLSFPLIDSFLAISVKQLNNKLYFLIDSSANAIAEPVNTKLYQYKISVSPFITQSFNGSKTGDSTSLLQWTISSIQNVKEFQILRSTDSSVYTSAPIWNVIGTVTPNAGTSYNFIDTFPKNGNNYYRIKIISNTGAYSYSPNLVLLNYSFSMPDCNVPTPFVYQLTDTSATLKFNNGESNVLYYQYAVIPWANQFATPPAGTTIYSTTDTIAHISGLTTGAKYYYYLRAVCANHGTTNWGAITFNTLCDTAGLPYTETFSDASISCIAPGNWYRPCGSGCTGLVLYNNSGWLFTKRFYLQAGKTYRVYFQYQVANSGTTTQNTPLILQMASYPDTLSLLASPIINLSLNTSQINYESLDSFALFTPAVSGLYCAGFYSVSNPAIGTVTIPEVEVLENPGVTPCTTNISPADKTTETNFCNNFPLIWNSVPNAFSYTLNISSVRFGSSSFTPYGVDTSVSENFCGDPGDTITWYVVPRVYGQNATGCSSSATVFYTPIEPAPANDLCANAQTLTVTKGFCTSPVVGDLMGATFSNASDTAGICTPALPPGFPAKNISDTSDVWYKLTVPSTGNFVVQVSKFNNATSDGTILRAFTGNCGSLIPIACAFDSNQYKPYIDPYRVRLYLTDQIPGANIYIRVASYFIDGNYFTIGAFDTTGSISPAIVSATNTCTAAVPVTMDSLSGNLYMWNPLFSASGQLLGEVNPAGLNFGTVNASLYVNSGTVRTSNSIPYLDRNIQITPTNTLNPYYFNTGIRLYVTQAEINAFNTASGNAVLSDFEVTDNTDNCGPALINPGTNLGKITDFGLYQGSNYYLSVLTPSFSSYYFFKGNGALPLHLLNFTAQQCNTSNVCLNWSTVSEVNVDNIVVEKSADGNSFKSIAVIKALDRSGTNYYSSVDEQPFNGNNFYRLKTVDIDGHVTYSKIIVVKFDMQTDIKVLPNPANNFITIYSSQAIQSVEIANEQGQVLQKSMAGGVLSKTIETSSFASGLYYVRIETSTGITVKKIIILK